MTAKYLSSRDWQYMLVGGSVKHLQGFYIFFFCFPLCLLLFWRAYNWLDDIKQTGGVFCDQVVDRLLLSNVNIFLCKK